MGCNRVAGAISNVSNEFYSKAKEDRCQLKTKILSTKQAIVSLQHFQQRMPWAMSDFNNIMDTLSKLQDAWAQCTYNSFVAKWAQAGIKSLLIVSKL